MNQNLVLAVLVSRNIINQAEAERLAEHLSTKPQSTHLADSINEVNHILNPLPVAPMPSGAPVGPEQAAEQRAAAESPATQPDNEKTEDELASQAADSTSGAVDSPAATGPSNATEAPGKEGAPVEATHAKDSDDSKADTGSKKASKKSSKK